MTEIGARVAGMASAVLFAKGATIIIAGLAFIIVSRVLGPTTYGLYVLASSFAGIFGAFSNLGISQSMSKFVSEHKASNNAHGLSATVSSGYIISGVIGLVIMLAAILLSGPISGVVFGTSSYSYLIVYASTLILLVTLFGVSSSALVGAGQGRDLVKATLIQIVVQSITSVSLALLGYGASSPIFGFALGLLIGTVYATRRLMVHNRISFSFPGFAAIRGLFAFSVPIGVPSIFSSVVSSSANIILGKFSSTADVGNVGVAQKTASIMSLASDSVSTALLPAIASVQPGRRAQPGRIYNYSLYVAMVVFAPIAFYMLFMAHSISYVMFGPSYALAPYYLAIVGIGIIFSILSDYTYALLVGRGIYNRKVSFSAIAVVLVELAILLALIPIIKGYGLILTVSILTPMLTFAVYARYAGRILHVEVRMARLGKVIGAALLSSLILLIPILVVRPSSIYGNLAVALGSAVAMIMFYPAVLALSGAVTNDDLNKIKALSKGVPFIGKILVIMANYAVGFSRP